MTINDESQQPELVENLVQIKASVTLYESRERGDIAKRGRNFSILVRAIPWPILDVAVFEFGLNVLRYAPLDTDRIHPAHILGCVARVSRVDTKS